MTTLEFIICFILIAIGIGTVLYGIVYTISKIADVLVFDKREERQRLRRETEAAEWLGEWGA